VSGKQFTIGPLATDLPIVEISWWTPARRHPGGGHARRFGGGGPAELRRHRSTRFAVRGRSRPGPVLGGTPRAAPCRTDTDRLFGGRPRSAAEIQEDFLTRGAHRGRRNPRRPPRAIPVAGRAGAPGARRDVHDGDVGDQPARRPPGSNTETMPRCPSAPCRCAMAWSRPTRGRTRSR